MEDLVIQQTKRIIEFKKHYPFPTTLEYVNLVETGQYVPDDKVIRQQYGYQVKLVVTTIASTVNGNNDTATVYCKDKRALTEYVESLHKYLGNTAEKEDYERVLGALPTWVSRVIGVIAIDRYSNVVDNLLYEITDYLNHD